MTSPQNKAALKAEVVTTLLVCVAATLVMMKAVLAGPIEDATAAYEQLDYSKALLLLQPLAEQGDVQAESLLGRMYDEGRGIPRDQSAAMKWYRLAAEQGDAAAEDYVGETYAVRGYLNGHADDFVEAAKWLKRAADQGISNAEYELGGLYEFGYGVPLDYVLAYMWFNLAAPEDSDSASSRDHVAKYMKPEQIAEAQRLSRQWRPRTPNETSSVLATHSQASLKSTRAAP